MTQERARLLDSRGRVAVRGAWPLCEERFRTLQLARPEPADHVVVLLHGLFRSRGAMTPMARALRRDGLATVTVHYPSTRRDIDGHATQIEGVLDRILGPTKVSFVGHSLGGIVARRVLDRPGSWRERLEPQRLVTIGSPHQGAAMAALLSRVPGFGTVAGPCLDELTPARSVPAAPSIDFAVIAGGRGRPQGRNPWLDGDDDMTVSVTEAQLAGADHSLVVNAVHTFIMMDRRVIDAVRCYLRTGQLHAVPALTPAGS